MPRSRANEAHFESPSEFWLTSAPQAAKREHRAKTPRLLSGLRRCSARGLSSHVERDVGLDLCRREQEMAPDGAGGGG